MLLPWPWTRPTRAFGEDEDENGGTFALLWDEAFGALHVRFDGAGRDGHRLESPTTRYTPCTPVFTPTGEVRPVAGSDYDFTSPASPPPTLDANLILGDTDSATPQHAATLTSAGGRRLEVRTTAPGIQVFTGKPYGIARAATLAECPRT